MDGQTPIPKPENEWAILLTILASFFILAVLSGLYHH